MPTTTIPECPRSKRASKANWNDHVDHSVAVSVAASDIVVPGTLQPLVGAADKLPQLRIHRFADTAISECRPQTALESPALPEYFGDRTFCNSKSRRRRARRDQPRTS